MTGVALVRYRQQKVVPGSRTDTRDCARHFKGVGAAEAAKILASLVAVGVALETREGQGGGRAWRSVR